jgi:hypothetical protein
VPRHRRLRHDAEYPPPCRLPATPAGRTLQADRQRQVLSRRQNLPMTRA